MITKVLRARTVELIAEIKEIESSEVKPRARLREDLGLDSLQSLELLSLLGEELKLDLPMEEAMEMVTVNDACDFVERTYTAQFGPG